MTKPLIRIDGGWLYVIAGLLVCTTGILIPVEQDLRDLKDQLQAVQTREYQTSLRLAATSNVLDQLDAGEPALLRRLAASQLNIVPAASTPILRSSAPPLPLSEWVEATIRDKTSVTTTRRRSLLTRLTSGRRRLWVFGVGVLCVFFGLLFDPALSAANHLRSLRLTRKRSSRRQDESVALEMTRSVQAPPVQAPPVQAPPIPPAPRSVWRHDDDADVNAKETPPELRICEEQWRAADSDIELDEIECRLEDDQDTSEEAIDSEDTKRIEPLVEIDLAAADEDAEEETDVDEGSAQDESDEEDEYEYVYEDVDEDDEGDDDDEYEYVYVDEDGNEIAAEDIQDYEME